MLVLILVMALLGVTVGFVLDVACNLSLSSASATRWSSW